MGQKGFIKFINTLRWALNMNVKTFAHAVGVHHAQVYRWLSGRTIPGKAALVKIRELHQQAMDAYLLPKPPTDADPEYWYDLPQDYIRRCEIRDARQEWYDAHPICITRSRKTKRSQFNVPMPAAPSLMIYEFHCYKMAFEKGEFSPYIDAELPTLGTAMTRLQNVLQLRDIQIAHSLGMTVHAWRDIRDSKRKPYPDETTILSTRIYTEVIHNDRFDEIFGPISQYDFDDDDDPAEVDSLESYVLRPPEPGTSKKPGNTSGVTTPTWRQFIDTFPL
jgi:transcriptional regulator with XRE-family HTH domain